MELYLILGYVGAVLIGLVLGLIGGGGSILALPILVYLFGIHPVTATAYSLFIVGTAALVGTVKNLGQNLIDLKTGIFFALPAITAVYLTRRYLVPDLPDPLLSTDSWELSKSMGLMILFAIIMVFTSISMIKDPSDKLELNGPSKRQYNSLIILLEGFLVGVLTGIVGAGGGFLIIPALVLLAKLPMKKAVATSLLIIAVKSLIGFIGDIQVLDIEWAFLSFFALLSIIGIFVGVYLNRIVSGQKLKKGFGWFILIMALVILVREGLHL